LNLIGDLDGTLVDSKVEILRSVELALRYAGVVLVYQRAKLKVGSTIDVILRDVFSPDKLQNEKLLEVVHHFSKRYDYCGFELTSAIIGIEEILKAPQRFIHYLVT